MTDLDFIPNFHEPITMSSREIAELVESRHDSVKRTVERLIASGVVSSSTPLVYFKNANNVTGQEYLISKRDSYVVVAQLSPEFTGRLVDRWQELEAKEAKPTANHVETIPVSSREAKITIDSLAVINAAMIVGRVSDVSRLAMARKVVEKLHPSSLEFLPVYAVNNPDGGESSFTHGSITTMLDKLIVTDANNKQLSVQKINTALEAHGFLRTLNYGPNSTPYKSVTSKGLDYGVNQVHVDYPNTTQPKWYHSRFKELMSRLGLTVRHKDKTVKVISTQKPNAKKLFKN